MTELWDKIAAFEDKEVGTGASERQIQDVEAATSLRIRGGFREFLRKYGWARFGHLEILGVGDGVKPHRAVAVVTRWEREDAEPPLPTRLLPVMADGAGNHYCLDLGCEPESEAHIVFWDHEQGAASASGEETFALWLSRRLDELREQGNIEINFDE